MNQTSNKMLFGLATLLLGIWLCAKLFWVIVEYTVLPLDGVNIQTSSIKSNLNYRYKFATNVQQVVKVEKKPMPIPVVEKKLPSLNDYKLVGIYRDDTDIIVSLQKGAKSFVLSKGDNIDGYVLIGGKLDTAYFKKNKKKYSIKIEKKVNTQTESSSIKSPLSQPTRRGTNRKQVPMKSGDAARSETSDSESAASQNQPSAPSNSGPVAISRDDINRYMEDPSKIRSDIGLRVVARDGSIEGYKVRFVRSSSPLGKVGLKRGDIIKSVNGEDVSNPAAAMNALKNIKNADNVTIKITRGNQEKELEYEIK